MYCGPWPVLFSTCRLDAVVQYCTCTSAFGSWSRLCQRTYPTLAGIQQFSFSRRLASHGRWIIPFGEVIVSRPHWSPWDPVLVAIGCNYLQGRKVIFTYKWPHFRVTLFQHAPPRPFSLEFGSGWVTACCELRYPSPSDTEVVRKHYKTKYTN